MKKIELYYLARCPYCRNARRAVDELLSEISAYGGIDIEWVEEREQAERAAGRDYYAVPTVFFGEEKLYEAQPGHDFDTIKENIKKAFDAVIKG